MNGRDHEVGKEEAVPWDASPASGRLPGERLSMGDRVLDDTELMYHLFVERVQDYAIFLMDADGVITHWGEGAQRVKEFTPAQVVGRHLSMLYPPEGAEDGSAEEHLRIAAEEGEYVGEGHRVAARRGRFPARVTLTALRRDGVLYGFGKVTQDLTERKQVEGMLKRALRAAETAGEEKGRFLATMSHEIRTPLNAILGYADLLDVGVGGTLSEVQRGYLDRVRASGRHLLGLLEDVLDFSRSEAGRLAVERSSTRILPAARAALALVRPQAEARGLSLRVGVDGGGDPEYWGDERRVQQVLVNLLSNAVKFTPPGGRIAVLCGEAREAPAEARLQGTGPWTWARVEDTGIGIPADRLESVFEPFVQVEAGLTRTQEGSGLGLAISRRLARLMGGDLVARSRPGAGSAFTLWLPASEAAGGEEAAREGGEEEAPLTRLARVLGASASAIVEAMADRLRADPATPLARERTESELEDHMGTLLTDVAQSLVILEQDGADAEEVARDGSELQALLARRHGEQRRRIGWSEAGLRREYEILRAEVDSVVADAGALVPGPAREEAASALARLLGRLEEVSLRAFREAEEGGGSA